MCYQLEFNRWSQLHISIDYSRIIQTEHHRVKDFLVCNKTGMITEEKPLVLQIQNSHETTAASVISGTF